MMCIFWTVVALVLLLGSLTIAVAWGFIVKWSDTQPSDLPDIPEDVPHDHRL